MGTRANKNGGAAYFGSALLANDQQSDSAGLRPFDEFRAGFDGTAEAAVVTS